MQTLASAPTSMKVAATLPTYRGPLGRFLAKQAEVQQARHSATVEQLAALSTTPIQYGPLATQRRQAAATLASMRTNVLDLLDEEQFTEAERMATAARVAECTCVAQLQRWFRNVYRVLTERRHSFSVAA